jgi:hypothetical protein
MLAINGGNQVVNHCKCLVVLPGLFLLILLVVAPAYAQNTYGCSAVGSNTNVNYTLHQPVSETVNNSCAATTANPSGPVVTLGGEYFFEYHCETKANGDLHVHWTSHYNLTGQDSSGVKYVGKDQQNYDLKLDPDGIFPPVPTSDFRTSDKFKLKAQGPTPDLTMTQKLHIKVDANGNATVDKEGEPVTKCK